MKRKILLNTRKYKNETKKALSGTTHALDNIKKAFSQKNGGEENGSGIAGDIIVAVIVTAALGAGLWVSVDKLPFWLWCIALLSIALLTVSSVIDIVIHAVSQTHRKSISDRMANAEELFDEGNDDFAKLIKQSSDKGYDVPLVPKKSVNSIIQSLKDDIMRLTGSEKAWNIIRIIVFEVTALAVAVCTGITMHTFFTDIIIQEWSPFMNSLAAVLSTICIYLSILVNLFLSVGVLFPGEGKFTSPMMLILLSMPIVFAVILLIEPLVAIALVLCIIIGPCVLCNGGCGGCDGCGVLGECCTGCCDECAF